MSGPKLGTERHTAGSRFCAKHVGGTLNGPDEKLCGRPADVHVIWRQVPGGWDNTPLCAEHARGIPHRMAAVHPLGPCCGMPGSRFDMARNVCHFDEGLPEAEPVRVVAEPVATSGRKGGPDA